MDAFGARASGAVGEMLALRGIAFHTATALRVEGGQLILEHGEPIPAEAVVALPRLLAPQIAGLPGDEEGFIPVDEYGRVRGLGAVYAAGDATSFPLKQGGIATQQADAAAAAIAAELGFAVSPTPFPPGAAGAAAHRPRAALPARRGPQRAGQPIDRPRGRNLVAAGEDRRAPPGPLPGAARRTGRPAAGRRCLGAGGSGRRGRNSARKRLIRAARVLSQVSAADRVGSRPAAAADLPELAAPAATPERSGVAQLAKEWASPGRGTRGSPHAPSRR